MSTFHLTKPRFIPLNPPVEIIPEHRLSKADSIALNNAVSSYQNPERVFQRKVTVLADILHCTEEEATHIILHNL